MTGDLAAEAARGALTSLDVAAIAYFAAMNTWYLVLLISAAFQLRTHLREIRGEARRRILASPFAPLVSVIAPAHDEQAAIAESVRALLTLEYPRLEVVVVNDGSTDRTLAILIETFGLIPLHPARRAQPLGTRPVRSLYRSLRYPELLVVDKENGGKADALNAGLCFATGELVLAIDADTLIEPDALQRMVRPFLRGDDVLAAGGTIRVVNDAVVESGRVVRASVPRRYLAGIQCAEYLRAFLFGRLGWNRLGGNLIVSGAFGVFRRKAMLAIGGYTHDSPGEDMELVARLRRHGYETGGPRRVEFVPDPVAWTEVPETLRVLGAQRDRWHRGLADSLLRHRDVLFRPRYGALGSLVFPYFIVGELLAPVVEVVGLAALALAIALDVVGLEFFVAFLLFAYGYGIVLTGATILLEQASFARYERPSDVARLFLWASLESFGYRQLTVYWRLCGLVRYLRGGTAAWGRMTRRGFATPDSKERAS